MTGCGVAWTTFLIWIQGTVGSNPTTQTLANVLQHKEIDMSFGPDGRYYADAEIKGKGAPDVREKLEAKLSGEEPADEPKPEPNKSVNPAERPAAGGEKVAGAVKEQQKK